MATGFIYTHVKRPIPCSETWIILCAIALIYAISIILQFRLLKALSISNERDLDFINYNLNRAAWILDEEDFSEKPIRPIWARKKDTNTLTKEDDNQYFISRKNKMRHLHTTITITILIELLSYFILVIMCFE